MPITIGAANDYTSAGFSTITPTMDSERLGVPGAMMLEAPVLLELPHRVGLLVAPGLSNGGYSACAEIGIMAVTAGDWSAMLNNITNNQRAYWGF